MNKRKRGISCWCILFIILLTIPVYGKTNEEIVEEDAMQWSEVEFATEFNATQSPSSLQSIMGLLIGEGLVQLSNETHSTLGVLAETLCHTYVDRIDMTIYLDILVPATDEDEEDWYTVTYYTYSWTKEDAPDKELYAVSVSFDIHDLEPRRYYRLRGAHYVYFGDSFEGRTSQTSWIPLSY